MTDFLEAYQSHSPIPVLESVAIPIISPVLEGPPDIIPGFLPRQGELVLAGETNIGKSLIALEVCSALITGQPLWGELTPTQTVKKILYVLGEHYNAVIQRLWQKTRLPLTDKVLLLGPEQLGYDKWLVSNGRPNIQAVSKFQKWCEGVDFIVFDPFSAFVTGVEGTENDNIQMRLVLDTMSLIAQGAGASCLVLAHQGKPSMGKDGKEHARKTYAIRGASGIEDAATNIFYMGRSEGDSEVSKSLDASILSLTKRKYKGDAPDEFRLMRDPGTLVHTLLGNRPFSEVQKMATQAKVGKMQAAFPDMPFGDVIKVIATMQDMHETTVKRHLGMFK